ncbi:MAG: hypothetical protein K0S47_2478 [Herbinix sp.]|jgi:hypothetical protein|nr:hypothetical protein [Herbinix sp.]
MAKGKKKKGLQLLSLFLILVLMIVLYVWYSNKSKEDSQTEEETDSISLAKVDSELLESFHFVNEKADMTLTKDGDGNWIVKANPERPINQTYVTNMISAIDEVTASRIVSESPENLADYGLDKPSILVEAKQKDGIGLTIKIGNEAAIGEGYYALVNEDTTVYLIASSYGTSLNYSDQDMTEVEDGPTITAENIRYVLVEKKDGNNFELQYEEGNDKDYTGANGIYPWLIRQPYEEIYTADSTKVSELLPTFTTYDFTACTEYDSQDISQYGLEDPAASVYVKYFETYEQSTEDSDTEDTQASGTDTESSDTADTAESEETTETIKVDKEYKLLIGNQDEDGNYYVKAEGSNSVFLMNASKIDPMLDVQPFDYINKFVNLVNIDSLDSVDITFDDTIYTLRLEREAKTNDDGKEETVVTYFYNDGEVEEELFKDVYQEIISASYDAQLKEAYNGDASPYLTITYKLTGGEGKEITTSYLPYDDSFYLVDTGARDFLADKRDVESIIKTVKEFKVEE